MGLRAMAQMEHITSCNNKSRQVQLHLHPHRRRQWECHRERSWVRITQFNYYLSLGLSQMLLSNRLKGEKTFYRS
eukprot:12343237-Ditylum_brightwellii.AAC.1